MVALSRILVIWPWKIWFGKASIVKVTGWPRCTLPMSASLTDTHTWMRVRSLAIRKRLGVLRLETTVWPMFTRRSIMMPLTGDMMVQYSKLTSMSHNVFKIRPPVAVRQCGSMPSQTQRNSGAPPSCYGAASYGHSYLLAPVRHPAVSRQARHVEKSSPAPPVVAHRDASPGSGAEDLGGTGPLDTSLDHRLALAPR